MLIGFVLVEGAARVCVFEWFCVYFCVRVCLRVRMCACVCLLDLCRRGRIRGRILTSKIGTLENKICACGEKLCRAQ